MPLIALLGWVTHSACYLFRLLLQWQEGIPPEHHPPGHLPQQACCKVKLHIYQWTVSGDIARFLELPLRTGSSDLLQQIKYWCYLLSVDLGKKQPVHSPHCWYHLHLSLSLLSFHEAQMLRNCLSQNLLRETEVLFSNFKNSGPQLASKAPNPTIMDI